MAIHLKENKYFVYELPSDYSNLIKPNFNTGMLDQISKFLIYEENDQFYFEFENKNFVKEKDDQFFFNRLTSLDHYIIKNT